MSSLYPDPNAVGPRPVFLGITIDNLHTYFMIFVVFAGIAGLILFLLSFKLKKMMHGIS
jgi:POT family proton-dependent oligopeptide transporter